MPRWIVFDQGTFARLRRQFPRENLFEHGARNAVEYATDRQEPIVAVLAIGPEKKAGVAVFRPFHGGAQLLNRLTAAAKSRFGEAKLPARKDSDPQPRPEQEPQVRAGGLLGLRDESYFDDQPKPRRKQAWWRRFWPEDD